MIPVNAPLIVNRGIAVFVPPTEGAQTKSFVTIKLFYSKNNPDFTWIKCDKTLVSLWEDNALEGETGNIFIYRALDVLSRGYYTILVTKITGGEAQIEGRKVVGFLRDQPRLIIGLPYSIYPAITLV